MSDTTTRRRSARNAARGASEAPTPSVRSRNTPGKAGRGGVNSKNVDTYGSRVSERASGHLKPKSTQTEMATLYEGQVPSGDQPTASSASNVGRSTRGRSASPESEIEEDPNSQLGETRELSGIGATLNVRQKVTSLRPNNSGIDGATIMQSRVNEYTIGQPIGEDENIGQQVPDRTQRSLGGFRGLSLNNIWLFPLIVAMLAMGGLLITFRNDVLSIRQELQDLISDRTPLESGKPQSAIYVDDFRQRLERFEVQLSKLTNVAPAFEEKYKIDYFDPRNGAATWPPYTSPEKMRPVGGWMGLFKKQVPFRQTVKIVGPFADVKKNWCAPSQHGKAQVAVLLPGKVVPKKLVVQQTHTLDQSLDVSDYPKQIELWARADWKYPDDENWSLPAAEGENRMLDPAHILPEGFMCIGRWEYNIHSKLATQSFIPQLNVNTSAVAVRINSNWGNVAQTCLHNLQLYGESNDEKEMYYANM